MVKEKLRKLRIDKGISQREIAACLPTDASNYNRKELGEVKITKAEWERIAAFLQVRKEEIYEEDKSNKNYSIRYKKPVFNDNAIGVIQYAEIMPSVVENLQELITIFKEENQNLKEENMTLKERLKKYEG